MDANGSAPREANLRRGGPSPRTLAAIGCFALAFALYAPSLDDYFLSDDFDLVGSFYGKPPSYFVSLLYSNESGDAWKEWGIDPEAGFGYLRPLKMWLLALDFLVWRTHAFGFHLTANVLFALDVALVFLILDRLLPGRRLFALLGAVLMAMHPIFAEIVPFITAREETLALLFVLAAFLGFLRFREEGRSPLAFHVFFALGLLSKESAIVTAGLVLGWDAVHGRLSPRGSRLSRDAMPLYLPMLLTLAVYFSLRFVAFGNLKGGDGRETQFLSVAEFLEFHRRFFASLFEPDLFSLAGIQGAGWIAAAAFGAALATVAMRGADRRRWLEFAFFGPVWYLASMSIVYGTYFANRHHATLVVGLVLFGTLLLAEVTRGLRRRVERAAAAAVLALCAAAFLPPTLSTVQLFGRASERVRIVRERIDLATRHLPDGSRVLVTNVPQVAEAPWFFGWGLLSALKQPFTESDLANRAIVVNPTNRLLTRSREPFPKDYDLVLELR